MHSMYQYVTKTVKIRETKKERARATYQMHFICALLLHAETSPEESMHILESHCMICKLNKTKWNHIHFMFMCSYSHFSCVHNGKWSSLPLHRIKPFQFSFLLFHAHINSFLLMIVNAVHVNYVLNFAVFILCNHWSKHIQLLHFTLFEFNLQIWVSFWWSRCHKTQ